MIVSIPMIKIMRILQIIMTTTFQGFVILKRIAFYICGQHKKHEQ